MSASRKLMYRLRIKEVISEINEHFIDINV